MGKIPMTPLASSVYEPCILKFHYKVAYFSWQSESYSENHYVLYLFMLHCSSRIFNAANMLLTCCGVEPEHLKVLTLGTIEIAGKDESKPPFGKYVNF